MSTLDPGTDWRLVMPVKGGPGAKTRLGASLVRDAARIAEAMALDSVAAALAALGPGRVLVVTSDAALARSVAGLGVLVVADPGAGLAAAVTAGLDDAAARWPHDARAVLLADVPALRPGDLGAALGVAAAYPRAFVPDHTGTGTVLLTARAGEPLGAQFGADSARRHAATGAQRLDLDLPSLRTDVDEAASLALALALGVGPRVAALAREAGLL